MRRYINLVNVLLYEADQRVAGLPDDVKFSHRQLNQILDQGHLRAVAAPGAKPNSYDIHLHPATPGRAQPFEKRPDRPTVSYYDPDLAHLETLDKDVEYLERTYARPNADRSDTFEPLSEKNVMYRGMSYEEYQNFLATGVIKSRGDYNFENQRGLTYWTTDPVTSRSYANSFAPQQWKPTIGHPCYVVAAPLPDKTEIQHVPGTGEHEIGVKRAVDADEIIAVWEGKVYAHYGDTYNLKPVDGYDHIDGAVRDGDTHRVRYGGYSADVVWERIQ